MESADLLLLVGLAIAGVLALAYVVFVLGPRGQKKYILACGAKTPPDTTPLTPLAPNPAPLPTDLPLLFRNRTTRTFLTVCSNCTVQAPITLSAHTTGNGFISREALWRVTAVTTGDPATSGWLLSSLAPTPRGVVTPIEHSQLFTITPPRSNRPAELPLLRLAPVDSNGYLLTFGQRVVTLCIDCPEFRTNQATGVIGTKIAKDRTPDQIWDVFVVRNGTITPLLA